ncbi:MAG: SufD family Fe-S cluster assembly protein [Candidatus Peribacteraceae bacterium]
MPSKRVQRRIQGTSKKPLLLAAQTDVKLTFAPKTEAVILHRVREGTPRVTLTLERGSHVTYVLICDGCSSELHSTVAANAEVRWHIFSTGDGSAHSLVSDVRGKDGISQIDWMFRAKKKQKQKIDIRNIFSATNGGGEMMLRGIAEDHASVDIRGMIDIGLKGGGTQTYLTEDVLMLDATAKVDALPGLEIKTNDVKASHSATVSRVTPDQLFYLQSRGLQKAIARQLFIDGFVGEMVDRVPELIRDQAVKALER